MMERVCAWCKSFLGYKPGQDGETTHDICPECYRRVTAELSTAAGEGVVAHG